MSTTREDAGGRYEIVVGKRLGGRSAAAFAGFEIADVPGDGTLLRSSEMDQAALHGILGRIRDLGIPLLSVRLLAEQIPGDRAPGSESAGGLGVRGSDRVASEAPSGEAE